MKNRLPQLNLRTIFVLISIALIAGGGLLVAFDPDRVFQAEVEVFPEYEGASGTIGVNTVLMDSNGDIIREYSPDNVYSGSLLDPATDKVASSYGISVSWEATGSNIDWTTMVVTGEVTYKDYIGVGYYGQAITVPQDILIASDSKTVDAIGQLDFLISDLEALMPDTLIDYYTPEERAPIPKEIDQKGPEAHAVIYVFTGAFSLSVYDQAANHLENNFDLRVELRLSWPGSSFEVTWNPDGVLPPDAEEPPVEEQNPDPIDVVDVVVDTSMDNLEGDEFIKFDAAVDDIDLLAGSIFGGGASEDIGVILVALGVGLFVLTVFVPKFTRPR